MPQTKDTRKARFLAALALSEMTMTQWAEQEGLTAGHVSQVLDGKRDSRTLMDKVETFTNERLAAAS